MVIAWSTDENLTDEEFYNRIDDLNFIGDVLDSTQYGSSPSILLTGVRGVGKTAMINQLIKKFDEDYLVISINLSNSDEYQVGQFTRVGFLKLFYKETVNASSKHFKLDTIFKRLEKHFKTQDVKFIKEFIDYEGFPIPIPGLDENYQKLSNFVMDLPQLIYEEHSDKLKRVFIFIDDFQIVKELDNLNSFLMYLRSKVQSQKNVAYLFAGSMGIKNSLIEDISGKNGAFGGRMLTINIDPFSYETTKSYILEKMPFLNLTDDGMERFFKCTRGIPAYINLFAKLIVHDAPLDENKVISEFNRVSPYLISHLLSQWFRLTYHEQEILVQLIDGPKKRVEIANGLKITAGSLSRPLIKLQDEFLIELNDDRKYEILDPILALWLKNEYKNKGVYPFRSF